MSEPLIKTGIYKHFKKGDLYFVSGTVIDAENDQNLVIYHALYKESVAFVRSLQNFNEMVHVTVATEAKAGEDELLGIAIEGKQVKRFELVKELDPKYLRFLLPGANVEWIVNSEVEKLYLMNEAIFIDISEGAKTTTTFLNNFLAIL